MQITFFYFLKLLRIEYNFSGFSHITMSKNAILGGTGMAGGATNRTMTDTLSAVTHNDKTVLPCCCFFPKKTCSVFKHADQRPFQFI